MPSQGDCLNERSSTPPVSSTMQALYAAGAADGVVLAAVLADVLGDVLAAGVLFEPHATSASAATPNTATVLSCFFTRILLGWDTPPPRTLGPRHCISAGSEPLPDAEDCSAYRYE